MQRCIATNFASTFYNMRYHLDSAVDRLTKVAITFDQECFREFVESTVGTSSLGTSCLHPSLHISCGKECRCSKTDLQTLPSSVKFRPVVAIPKKHLLLSGSWFSDFPDLIRCLEHACSRADSRWVVYKSVDRENWEKLKDRTLAADKDCKAFVDIDSVQALHCLMRS